MDGTTGLRGGTRTSTNSEQPMGLGRKISKKEETKKRKEAKRSKEENEEEKKKKERERERDGDGWMEKEERKRVRKGTLFFSLRENNTRGSSAHQRRSRKALFFSQCEAIWLRQK